MHPATFPPGDAITAQAPASWWYRHRVLVVAVSVVVAVLAMSGFVMLVLSLTVGLMRSSGAYQQAVAAARADATVIETLGTPIEEGFLIAGEIHLTNHGGYANLSIPISGPDGKATIYVEAEKSGDDWSFRALEVVVRDTGQWIHLRDSLERSARPSGQTSMSKPLSRGDRERGNEHAPIVDQR